MEPVMNTTLTSLSAVTTFVTATALVLAGAVGLIEGFAKSLPHRFLLGLLPFLVDIYFYMAFYDASAALLDMVISRAGAGCSYIR